MSSEHVVVSNCCACRGGEFPPTCEAWSDSAPQSMSVSISKVERMRTSVVGVRTFTDYERSISMSGTIYRDPSNPYELVGTIYGTGHSVEETYGGSLGGAFDGSDWVPPPSDQLCIPCAQCCENVFLCVRIERAFSVSMRVRIACAAFPDGTAVYTSVSGDSFQWTQTACESTRGPICPEDPDEWPPTDPCDGYGSPGDVQFGGFWIGSIDAGLADFLQSVSFSNSEVQSWTDDGTGANGPGVVSFYFCYDYALTTPENPLGLKCVCVDQLPGDPVPWIVNLISCPIIRTTEAMQSVVIA